MEKKRFERPKIIIVEINSDEIVSCSGPTPVDKIVKDSGSFGFDPNEVL